MCDYIVAMTESRQKKKDQIYIIFLLHIRAGLIRSFMIPTGNFVWGMEPGIAM